MKVGYRAGRELAHQRELPFVAVNHLEAHVLVPRMLSPDALTFPFLAMLVSGGHCMLLLTRGVDDHVRLGTTHDDSLGEAYDKVARMLGLGFGDYADGGGGGAALERLAQEGDEDSIPFPVPLKRRKDCMFSFSGLKTAVFLACEKLGGTGSDGDGGGGGGGKGPGMRRQDRANVAASFQKAARLHLQQRLKYALKWCDDEVEKGTLSLPPTSVVVTGGVASNQYLREHLKQVVEETNGRKRKGKMAHPATAALDICFPPPRLCTDNGVMVAWAGHERMAVGLLDDATPPVDGLEPFKTRWPLGGDNVKNKKGRVLVDTPVL